ncbi:MAG: glycosyltransferase family 2 protein [Vicinamibacterales bacterium]
MSKLRMLGVLLCYNDGDILPDAIEHLLENEHDVVVWNHGSTDETADVLRRMRHHLVEMTDISRSVDFYDLYPLMSKHLIAEYVPRYHWISWPDQDELLEGPTRGRPYCRWLEEVATSPHSWIEFNDFVYWHTDADDATVVSPCQRVRHYSMAKHGPPKIRSWRASATNIRWFNHNRAEGSRYPALFNLRHYPMRSEAQQRRRITVDRAGIQHGPVNFHYENMKTTLATARVRARDLHCDDGTSPLCPEMRFDWSAIYGKPPKLPPEVLLTYLLSTKRWELAVTIRNSITTMPAAVLEAFERQRIDSWLQWLETKAGDVITIVFEGTHNTRIVTDQVLREWSETGSTPEVSAAAAATRSLDASLGRTAVTIVADAAARTVRVVARGGAGQPRLLALVPSHGGDVGRVAALDSGVAEFTGLRTMYYFLTSDSRESAALAVSA